MPPFISSPITFSFLTLALPSLYSLSFCSSALAQEFRPAPNHALCSAFIEGQGMYILGGYGDDNFMLDLSVSWNTSDPVFRKLEGGPSSMGSPCAATEDELFMLVQGTGYIYNVISSSWRAVHNNYFTLYEVFLAAADPNTGTVYIVDEGFTDMLSLNLKTGAYKQSTIDIENAIVSRSPYFLVWNEYLKGILGETTDNPYFYAPSKVSNSSIWSEMVRPSLVFWPICGAAAYSGTKMVYLASGGRAVMFDVVKKTWKYGPQGPDLLETSCAVSGDHFIVWGGLNQNESPTNGTFVFNMKTQKWISGYTAPPSQSTTATISHTTQPTQTPTQNVQNATSNQSDFKIITIVIIITGIVVAINMWLIIRHRRAKRLNRENSSADSLNIKDDGVSDSLNIKDDHASDSSGPPGRLHQGLFGARPLSEHPHATVKDLTPERNVQEGALEVHFPPQQPHTKVGMEFDPIYAPQQPHAIVGNEFDPIYSGKVIGEPTRYYGKEELEDQ